MQTKTYRLGIKAYLAQIFLSILILIIINVASEFINGFLYQHDADGIVIFLWFCMVTIRIIELRKTKLIIDENGVYLYSGIFPWDKGYFGIDWKYIESAYCEKGFIPWITNCYNITLTKKNKNSEFKVFYVYKGNKAVAYINNFLDNLD